MLHPRVTILVRPSGVVQLGWDPERALLLEPPDLDTQTVLGFLRLLDGLRTRPQILWQAGRSGIAAERAATLLAEIDAAGLLVQPRDRPGPIRAVRVHGLGPLSDAISAGLRRVGIRPVRSRGDAPEAVVTGPRADDLVVLADTVVTDPRLASALVLHRIPHLPVRVRDGTGVVGPLVLPGETSCLRCADLTRVDYDAEWPHLAAQLLGRVGHASPAAIAATAALALGELEAILDCSPRRPPATLDATLELDLDSHLLQRRYWAPHAACGCRTIGAGRAT
ncbi:bacteriocin biosynthesis cyclodehydratase domain-containing protein [Nocardia amikacinitolerans]|nr:bacteriocin biosynthesis cyclodehydratase domain-containing protein [Nocardia amikacinitolerans]